MAADDRQTCKVIRSGDAYTGKQTFTYFAGVSAENTGFKHCIGCQFRFETRVEIFTDWLGEKIVIIFLHQIINNNFIWFHGDP